VFYRLVGTAAAVWTRLASGVTIASLTADLTAQYGAEPAQEVGAFVAALAAEGLVVTDPPSGGGPPPDPPVAWPESFTPLAFHKHADMADLLLVDPIHDVDVEEGWPERRDA
jgi:coenzyme PQQ synthesis protein D (PqqD)